MIDIQAQKEKRSVAINSVIAAIGLTVLKLVVGILTNSLGILAEAAHSGLDLLAAVMTSVAVHISDKPADKEHPFGHGKVENLSALFETLLLMGTAVWIISEAVQRLFFEAEEVQGSIWAFVVMVVSIIVDYNRSRNLSRVAKKYNSQALEADALHFSTDIWSSSVVLVGLFGMWLAGRFPKLHWMIQADAIAALVVALIVIYVSGEMGWRTIQALLDASPKGIKEQITDIVKGLDGVENCHRVRVRPSGGRWFVDMHIEMKAKESLQVAHVKTETIEEIIQHLLPQADVTVHTEPGKTIC